MIASRILAGSLLWTMEKSAAAARFSAAFIPTGRSQRAKIFFGPREKLRHARARYGVVIAGRSFGSPGFSPEDRVENIRRVSEVAKLMADAGAVVITAFISPYRMDRRRAREIALEGNAEFIEVFVDAPLEVCETRDPKSLYKKARAGEIRDFTRIGANYEALEDLEIVVHTD